MLEGTIKFFLTDKKYGFITPGEPGPEVYVHHDQMEGGPYCDGDKVQYALQEGRKGAVAVDVRLLHPSSKEPDVDE